MKCKYIVICAGLPTYSTSDNDVLGEDNTLSLNDEEVDELLNIIERRLHCLLGDLVVLAWADRGCEAGTQADLACDFGHGNDYESVIIVLNLSGCDCTHDRGPSMLP